MGESCSRCAFEASVCRGGFRDKINGVYPSSFYKTRPTPPFHPDIFEVRSRLAIRWVLLSGLGLIDCLAVGEWAGFVVPLSVTRWIEYLNPPLHLNFWTLDKQIK